MLNTTTNELKDNKMTPARILELYKDLLNRYKEYVEDNEVDFPYEELPGMILFHLPPIHGRADDKENFKGTFIPDDVYEGTVIARMDSDNWGFPANIFDTATDYSIRDLVSQMLFSNGNESYEFLDSQEF